ncbi:MAG TPA: hypothetical protein VKX17_01380 [Planctomycetota bacterium]|nr:hypothetical protein [Planctomycetota bacterium]
MKFQFRLLTLLAFVVSLGVFIGLNVTTKWQVSYGRFRAYGWPVPLYYEDRAYIKIGEFGPERILGPGIEFDGLVIDTLVAAAGIAGACYVARRINKSSAK